jgi:hypothetical protein
MILALTAGQSIRMHLSPQTFPYHSDMRWQFIDGASSGYGLEDAVAKIHDLSSQHPDGIRILRSPWWDVPLQSLDVYYRDLGPRVQRITIYDWDPNRIVPRLSELISDGTPSYLLFNGAYPYPDDSEVIGKIQRNFDVEEVAHFIKPSCPGLKLWCLNMRRDTGNKEAGE